VTKFDGFFGHKFEKNLSYSLKRLMITSAKGQSSPKNKIYTQLEAVIDLLSFLANTDKLFKDDLIMILSNSAPH